MKRLLSVLLVTVISISSICVCNKVSALNNEEPEEALVDEEHQEVVQVEEPGSEEVVDENKEEQNAVQPEENNEENLVEESVPEGNTEQDQQTEEEQPEVVDSLENEQELVEPLSVPEPETEPPTESIDPPQEEPVEIVNIDQLKEYFVWEDPEAEVKDNGDGTTHLYYHYSGIEKYPKLSQQVEIPGYMVKEISYSYAHGIDGSALLDNESIANAGVWRVMAHVTIVDENNEPLVVQIGTQEVFDDFGELIGYAPIMGEPVLSYNFEVFQKNITFDYSDRYQYYDGNEKTEELSFFKEDYDGEELELSYSVEYKDILGNVVTPKDPGMYIGYVTLTDQSAINYHLNCQNYFVFYIFEQKLIKFAGFDIGDADQQVIKAKGRDFIWKKDKETGEVYLEYNGYSPIFDLTEEVEYALPKAKFVYENGEPVEEELVRGVGGDYIFIWNPVDLHVGFPVNVGSYNLTIVFNACGKYRPICNSATFQIRPKPVSVKWTNTTIDVADKTISKVPGYKIEGIIGRDELGCIELNELYLTFRTLDGKQCLLPTKPGQYIAKAEYVRVVGTLIPNYNYVLDGTYETSYVIVDSSSIRRVYLNDIGGSLTIGEINESSIKSISFDLPTKEEAWALINFLKSSPEYSTLGYKIENEINNGGNVNLYILARDIANPSLLTLPSGKTQNDVVMVDIELFACLDNDPTRYEINDTGNYQVAVNMGIDEIQASKISLTSNRNSYVVRYHNTYAPENTTQVSPIVSGEIGRRTYTFKFKSNKFSPYLIYTEKKPTIEYTSRVIPNTRIK